MPVLPAPFSLRFVIASSLVLLHLCHPSSPFSTTTPKTIRTQPYVDDDDYDDDTSGLLRDSTTTTTTSTIDNPSESPSRLSGDWSTAKQSLRNPQCCVVSVQGLERHLSILQQCFCGDDAPTDLDLRMRVRCGKNTNDVEGLAVEDCAKIYDAVMDPSSSSSSSSFTKDSNASRDINSNQKVNEHSSMDTIQNRCILALEELARGVASLADGPLEGTCTDVHMRVVCASNYRAIDPMWHTDKCPLRGYVTLTGSGTEYMSQTCLPWEYAALRSLGVQGLSAVSGNGTRSKVQSLKMANELEFIVMKGDHYAAPPPEDRIAMPRQSTAVEDVLRKVWDRSAACVHRSPPNADGSSSLEKEGLGTTKGGSSRRRVILSLDLADGRDDQEWYEISRKRGWRSGMTQRKSRLVS